MDKAEPGPSLPEVAALTLSQGAWLAGGDEIVLGADAAGELFDDDPVGQTLFVGVGPQRFTAGASAVIDSGIVLLAVGIAGAVGVVFGLFPAMRAA